MTSLKNIPGIVEPVLTAVAMGVPVSLLFCFCQYLTERKRRREFRNSLQNAGQKDQAGRAKGTQPSAASRRALVAALWQNRAAGPGTESFPSFASYFMHHLGRYGTAILSVALVLVIRWSLEPLLKGSMPFSFFLAAVLFTARTQGMWETLAALVLGFLSGSWFFAEPESLGISEMHDWWAAIVYFVVGIGILWLLQSEQTAWLRTLGSDIAALKRARELEQERASREQLPGTRELLANIVESTQVAILSITPDGRIMTWNAAAERLFGWPAKEAIGRPLTIMLPAGHQAELQQITEQVGRGESAKNWQTTLSSKTGTRVEALITVSPVNDPSSGIVAVSLIVQDRPQNLERLSKSGSVLI